MLLTRPHSRHARKSQHARTTEQEAETFTMDQKLGVSHLKYFRGLPPSSLHLCVSGWSCNDASSVVRACVLCFLNCHLFIVLNHALRLRNAVTKAFPERSQRSSSNLSTHTLLASAHRSRDIDLSGTNHACTSLRTHRPQWLLGEPLCIKRQRSRSTFERRR